MKAKTLKDTYTERKNNLCYGRYSLLSLSSAYLCRAPRGMSEDDKQKLSKIGTEKLHLLSELMYSEPFCGTISERQRREIRITPFVNERELAAHCVYDEAHVVRLATELCGYRIGDTEIYEKIIKACRESARQVSVITRYDEYFVKNFTI